MRSRPGSGNDERGSQAASSSSAADTAVADRSANGRSCRTTEAEFFLAKCCSAATTAASAPTARTSSTEHNKRGAQIWRDHCPGGHLRQNARARRVRVVGTREVGTTPLLMMKTHLWKGDRGCRGVLPHEVCTFRRGIAAASILAFEHCFRNISASTPSLRARWPRDACAICAPSGLPFSHCCFPRTCSSSSAARLQVATYIEPDDALRGVHREKNHHTWRRRQWRCPRHASASTSC